jgi:hypothetical protein
MLNTISQDQNAPQQLERLAAQRYLYSTAKRLLTGQLFLDLVPPIALAVTVALFPDFGIYGALIALLILVSDLYLEILQSSKQEQAAGIQELFDCKLLHLQCPDLIARNIPDTVEIMEFAERYQQFDPTYKELKDWYSSEVEKLPLHLARLVCQRANCLWDVQLRRKYLKDVKITFFILCIIVMIIALVKGLTVGNFLLVVVAPLLPAIWWFIRELREQNESIRRKVELKSYAEEIWDDAIKKRIPVEEIERKSRGLQDQIYSNRCNNPLILDTFYKHSRQKNETQMNRSAKDLTDEALQSLGKSSNP